MLLGSCQNVGVHILFMFIIELAFLNLAYYMVVWLLGARKSQSWDVVIVQFATSAKESKSQTFYFVKIV